MGQHATTLTERLQQLTPDERAAMEEVMRTYGLAYTVANWNLILGQVRYVLTL
jgi:hypothetical protein